MNATTGPADTIRRLHDAQCSDPVAWAGAVIGQLGPDRTKAAWCDQLNAVHAALAYLPGGALGDPRVVMVQAVVEMLRGEYPDNDDGTGLLDDLVSAALPADVREELVTFALEMVKASGMAAEGDMTQRCLLARDLLRLDGSRESMCRVHDVLQDEWSLTLYMEDLTERLSRVTDQVIAALAR